ncbi:heme biosynthesis protein HemY [Mergibacter septicus]|uniref:Heme biosynthesis protein HemY n=1 Tax=Mergibacter septicus TaxID=221402 RepID=A0A8E3SCA7_9PAST|nr:heme biosynthesis HemY N-terminal domain-containing protein [Mergibacter septicus]AWX16112.1 heme biosynthesis protein HemY [Mergibacter septicus]QDJ15365.1 heme biosynthesis protein HemY [Mergibacter septicus]UTU48765.1 heme biosynthesis protein HemY [Mergibacter septicus]WMR95603.1 heme biosynthesis HemY N-terminal domain-containing protein [Mergibacter septicus]
MFRLLFLMLILLAGFIVGPYISDQQGYVLILTQNTRIEMSFVTLIIIFVIVLALIYGIELILTRIRYWSSNTYNWFSNRKRRKAQQQTVEGLLHMHEGNYAKAEKLISKSAKHAEAPVLNFIKAAEAAQQRNDEFSANQYLMEATEIAGTDNLTLELARTRIFLMQKKLPSARTSIDSLLVLAPKNAEVLKLAITIYQQSSAFAALDKILPNIERGGIFTAVEMTRLEHQVIDGLLNEIMNEESSDGLLKWWEAQSKARRNDLYTRIRVIHYLLDTQDDESAYTLILETIKKVQLEINIDDLLVEIARLQVEDSSKLIKQLEKYTAKFKGSVVTESLFNRALGYLYARNNQFEHARTAFKTVLSLGQTEPYDYTMAAYIAEQLKNDDEAHQIRQISLQQAMKINNQDLKSAQKLDQQEAK